MPMVFAALFVSLVTPFAHIRSTEPELRAAVDAGVAHSDSFRELVDRLDASDVVVHIVYDHDPAPGIAGHLTFAASAGGVRYLRIAIVPRLSGYDLLAILGHELEHAVEIADAPSVVDQASMAAFYAAVGERRLSDRGSMFDTAAAVAAGDRIRREVLGGGRVDAPERRP